MNRPGACPGCMTRDVQARVRLRRQSIRIQESKTPADFSSKHDYMVDALHSKEDRVMKRISAALAVAALIGFAGERAAAQSRGLGALAGTVTEESGAGIAGVLVKLPLPDGSAIEAKTDDAGKWNVNGIG